jgi:hypothetical protein
VLSAARTQISLDGEFAQSRGPEPLGSVTPNVSKMLLLPRAVLLLLPPALRASAAAVVVVVAVAERVLQVVAVVWCV